MSEPQQETAMSLESEAEHLHVDFWESVWIRISIVVLVIFVLCVLFAGSAYSIQVPGAYARIDPNTLLTPEVSQFAEPEVRELAPGHYEAYVRAQIWRFEPSEIRVPTGSKVTFYVTALDVQHGFKIVDTNINMMALPGQIATLTAEFDEPGTYNIICHEYCGALHHTMYGQIIVE